MQILLIQKAHRPQGGRLWCHLLLGAVEVLNDLHLLLFACNALRQHIECEHQIAAFLLTVLLQFCSGEHQIHRDILPIVS